MAPVVSVENVSLHQISVLNSFHRYAAVMEKHTAMPVKQHRLE
jgi:hypothetical protein